MRSAEPSPSRCSWPTNSSSVRGRIRAASGPSSAGGSGRRRGVAGGRTAVSMRQYGRPPLRSADGARRTSPGRDRRRPAPADPLQHGQPARRRARVPGVAARATSRTPGFECELDGAEPERPNLVARAARASERARRSATSRTSTPCSPTPRTGRTTRGRARSHDGFLWGRGALDMKSQTAAEAVAAARWRATAGGRRAAS